MLKTSGIILNFVKCDDGTVVSPEYPHLLGRKLKYLDIRVLMSNFEMVPQKHLSPPPFFMGKSFNFRTMTAGKAANLFSHQDVWGREEFVRETKYKAE